jgi:hypothetical protein
VLQVAPCLDAGAVSRHQLAGILTLVVLGGLAAYAGILLRASSRRGIPSARAKGAALVLAVAGFSMALWTSDLGGAIRHTELRTYSAHQAEPSEACQPRLCHDQRRSCQFVFSWATRTGTRATGRRELVNFWHAETGYLAAGFDGACPRNSPDSQARRSKID